MSSTQALVSKEPLLENIKVPKHIGVIMDGNGRWAKARGLPRSEGHRAGVESVRRIVELSIRYRVQCLTLFSFSSENWRRPPEEVNFIFGLLRRFVASDLARLAAQNVRIRIIGDRDSLESGMKSIIAEAESKTAANNGLDLIIAFNYGAKAEIIDAVKRIAAKARTGEIDIATIDEATISKHLHTQDLPDPDLILRTSGEMRLSNFLLWQSAYSELVFVDESWPDFDEAVFLRALQEFTNRDRRFGGVES